MSDATDRSLMLFRCHQWPASSQRARTFPPHLQTTPSSSFSCSIHLFTCRHPCSSVLAYLPPSRSLCSSKNIWRKKRVRVFLLHSEWPSLPASAMALSWVTDNAAMHRWDTWTVTSSRAITNERNKRFSSLIKWFCVHDWTADSVHCQCLLMLGKPCVLAW